MKQQKSQVMNKFLEQKRGKGDKQDNQILFEKVIPPFY